MTTREILNRRFFAGILWLVAALFVLGMLQYGALGERIDGTPLEVAAASAFLIILVYRWLTPCLSCGKPFKGFALLWRPTNSPLDSPHCPYCDVSIDQEISTGPK